ncbi:MAG: hypothetical protein WD556_03705 [Actinomycetota bacterium]
MQTPIEATTSAGGRRLGRLLAAVLFVALLAPAPALLSAAPACADSDQHAALVVDTGGQELSYCVAIPGTVDGIELLRLASRQYGLSYSLGFGGEAVCMIAGVGVSGGDCFADFPRFWGYWRGAPSGGWSWSSVGAGSVSVSPGDVQGWSWGSGQDGSNHPAPPVTPFTSVCEPDDPPGNGGNGGNGGSNGGGASGGSGGTASDAGGSGNGGPANGNGNQNGSDDERRREERNDGNDRNARPEDDRPPRTGVDDTAMTDEAVAASATPVNAVALGDAEDGSSGAAGAVVSLVALAVLIGAGAFLTWKRRVG